MKNKIMLLISAALLFTITSAYAKETKTENQNTQVKNAISATMQEKDLKDLTNTIQELKQNAEKDKLNNPITEYCKGDKYCLDIIKLLEPQNKKELAEIFEIPELSKDYKQALYQIKVSLVLTSFLAKHKVILFEAEKMKDMAENNENLMDFITDMPLTEEMFVIMRAAELEDTAEFMKTLPEQIPYCNDMNLDMHNYNKDNLCVISERIMTE